MADVIPVKRYSTGLAELQSGDTINWSWLSGIPAYATRWPSWSEVTSKPSSFTPDAHTHTWADITGTVPTWNQNTTGSAASLTTARTLQIGNTGKTFNGTENVSWTLSEIGALAASTVGAASGVAPLGADMKVPSSYLPSYVDDVLEYSSLSAFPTTGETGKIYVADNTGKIYRWSGSTYIEISPSPGSTDAVPEGSTNLYFTTARAAAAAPVQSVNGKTGVISLTYTDVSAAPSSHVGAGGTAHAAATTSAAGFMSAEDKTKLDGIAAGATANTGTVTSVGLSAPTGLSVSGSPITNSGTLALSWASGYQGYTTDEAIKLSGIEAGATAGADSWNSPINLTVGSKTTALDGSTNVAFTPKEMRMPTTDVLYSSHTFPDWETFHADLAANSAFVGSGLVVGSWKCGISCRHAGGIGVDGTKYGLFIYDNSMTSTSTVGNINVQKQVNGSWQDPQTIAFDSQVVHLTGNESISGVKTFTATQIRSQSDAPGIWLDETDGPYGVYIVMDSGNFQFQARNAGFGGYAAALLAINTATSKSLIAYNFGPTASNSYSCGTSTNLWTQVYATNATINTSDARLKTTPRDMTEAELAAFGAIARLPMVWQWLSKVESEGEDTARLHSGPTVQAAMAIMEANGLNWQRYSAFCYDEWEASRGDVLADGEEWGGETETVEEADTDPETGEIITVTRTYKVNPAGDRYSFRKEELLWWCMRALFAEHDALAARVAALETA